MNILSSLLNFIGKKIQESQSLIKIETIQYTLPTINGGAAYTVSGNEVGYSGAPTGYVILGVRRFLFFNAGATQMTYDSVRLSAGAAQFVKVRNMGTTAVSGVEIQVGIVYIKNGYWADR